MTAIDGIAIRSTKLAKESGPFQRGLRLFTRDRIAMVSLAWIAIVGAVALVGLVWTPHPPNEQLVGELLSGPSSANWLGTDDLGRDLASRLMIGASVALRVSFFVVSVAVAIAIPIGLLAGYRGGYVDAAIIRILDVVTSIPGIVAALAIVGVLGPGLFNVSIALIVVLVPSFVRLVRAQALSVSAEPFITASRSVGSGTSWILFTRVLPGVIPALSVQISLGLGSALTAEAALSFLGVGVTPPDASWGGDLARAYRNIVRHPGGIIAPMLAIGSVVLAFNLIGDGLRDALGVGTHRRIRRRSKTGITTVDRSEPPATATEMTPGTRLEVRELCVAFERHRGGRLEALDRVSLSVAPGEVLGIVGESGSGKTLTAMSLNRLLGSPPAVITGGQVLYDGTDLLGLSLKEMRRIRGAEIAMVFQNPLTSLDPVYTVGNSLREAIRNHEPMSRRAANDRAVELLGMVGIPEPRRRLDEYPHSFSGGMRQRVVLAMALAGRPKLLVADEPTTALDVTIQAQILELLASLRHELDMSIILVTHDLGVVADICDRVAVMYAGQIVETGPVDSIFSSPTHPYTAGLLAAMPSMGSGAGRLVTLPGSVPHLDAMPDGCRFAPRCPHASDACREAVPEFREVGDHTVRCIAPLVVDQVVTRAGEGSHDG